jgi:hypothetical protein
MKLVEKSSIEVLVKPLPISAVDPMLSSKKKIIR